MNFWFLIFDFWKKYWDDGIVREKIRSRAIDHNDCSHNDYSRIIFKKQIIPLILTTSFCFGNDECINAWNIRVHIRMVTFLIMIVLRINIYFKSPYSVITNCLDLKLIPLEWPQIRDTLYHQDYQASKILCNYESHLMGGSERIIRVKVPSNTSVSITRSLVIRDLGSL